MAHHARGKGGEYDESQLPKMSKPECQTVHELDDLRPKNDSAAIANVDLSEFGMSAPMAGGVSFRSF